MCKNLQVIIIALIFSLAMTGCASTTKPKQSGFLKDYSGFVNAENYKNTKIFRAPTFSQKSLASVSEIKLVPFEIWLKPSAEVHFNAQQLLGFSRYFFQQLKTKLTKNNYKIVDKISANTLTIRGAFSGVKIAPPELEALDFLPFRIVLNTGNLAYLEATDQKDIITNVSIEAEFLQGIAQKRVFALMASKEIDMTVADNIQGNENAVHEVLTIWIDNFVNTLVAAKAKYST